MMLAAYGQGAPSRALHIWVAIFGTATPPALIVNAGEGQVDQISPLRPIRDFETDANGRPLNHRAIFRITGLTRDTQYRIVVQAGTESLVLVTRTLPEELPRKLDGTFNILLSSCYSQPEDGSGLVGNIVSQIKLRPHMTMLLGDQIYGDLPLLEHLPDTVAGIAQKLGAKYKTNWASGALGTAGLTQVLNRAPVFCVADDHEFWNNYPFPQAQLQNTWTADGRRDWRVAATDLYEDYQLAGAAGDVSRVDIAPLKLIVADMRTGRDADFGNLLSKESLAKIENWEADLIADRQAGKPAFGLLSSGQALFADATDNALRKLLDAGLANYDQFESALLPVFERLSEAGIPVIYVTGDVHWSRVSQARYLRSSQLMVYEVIASPSRLIRIPVVDAAKEAAADLGGIFGRKTPWPRHSRAQGVPARFGQKKKYKLECDLENRFGYARQGDHVAILSLCQAGSGIDFNVTYYGISEDKELARSDTTRTYELRNT